MRHSLCERMHGLLVWDGRMERATGGESGSAEVSSVGDLSQSPLSIVHSNVPSNARVAFSDWMTCFFVPAAGAQQETITMAGTPYRRSHCQSFSKGSSTRPWLVNYQHRPSPCQQATSSCYAGCVCTVDTVCMQPKRRWVNSLSWMLT